MAAVTALGIIRRSMRLIRAVASGESPNADEQSDGLTALNAMVDAWLTEQMTIPEVRRVTEVLVANTQDYTIGSGATIDIARPLWIPDAAIIPAGLTAETQIRVLTDQEWAQKVPIKSQTATFPLAIYYNYAFNSSGYGTISTWPIQTTAPTLVIYIPVAVLTSFTTVSTSYQVPPGYERTLAYNLALEIAPEYGKRPSAEVVAIAAASKGDMKRSNERMEEMYVDNAILRRGNGNFNWRTGTGG